MQAKYEMLSGPFVGEIVEEGYTFISHQKFEDLDNDMQQRVRDFASQHGISDLDDAVEQYENSWESAEL